MRIRLSIILICCCLAFFGKLFGQDAENYYWIAFADKNGTAYRVDHPEEFLSARAIERRSRQGIAVDESDLPLSAAYLQRVAALGAHIVHQSKWLNGCTVRATESQVASIAAFNFVTGVEMTKTGFISRRTRQKWDDEKTSLSVDSSNYGRAVNQLTQLNGQFLHTNNFKGQGIQIALLDAGFLQVDQLEAFEDLRRSGRLLGIRDFVDFDSNIFEQHYHGLSVLSTMAANWPGEMVGTAPEASYYLFRTEDVESEFLIEEDNWVAAAEYADSLGVDLINSSLGYCEFDDSAMNHTYQDMDGHTTRISRAASLAVKKGILVFTSNGNEANNAWYYLVAPADGDGVIGVGAVNSSGEWAPFSSVGPASDGDVKPNLVALGWGASVISAQGTVGISNGTSFSSPILAGMAACLWQANPGATVTQIYNALEQSASQYGNPDSQLGYGIPDFQLADELLKAELEPFDDQWFIYPNPVVDQNYLYLDPAIQSDWVELTIVNLSGQILLKRRMSLTHPLELPTMANWPAGLYLAQVRYDGGRKNIKFVKGNR